MRVSIGADPEFFLFDIDLKAYVSAHDLVPGDKQKPFPVKGGAVQVDGTAVEFNIEPANSSIEFENNVNTVLGVLRGMIPEKYEFRYVPSIQYREDIWNKIPPKQLELGCDPDFNAAIELNKPQPRPRADNVNRYRMAGGHIHLGYGENIDINDQSSFWDCRQLTLAFHSIYKNMRSLWDTDQKRQRMYGANAAFRPKKYGVEFRSPSNAWLNYPRLYGWFFDVSKAIFRTMRNGGNVPLAASEAWFRKIDLWYGGPQHELPLIGYAKLQKTYPLFPDFPYAEKELKELVNA